MSRLERRCRRLARVHPDPVRREELVTTLLDGNAGRRAPRSGDAFDVVRHGVAARLGTRPPSARFGVWGDALAVAVVQAVVTQAATAAALAPRAAWRHPHRAGYRDGAGPMFYSREEAWLAVLATLLAAAAAVAACRGAVLAARGSVLLAAVAGSAAVVAGRAAGNDLTFSTPGGRAAAAVGALTLVAVLATPAVARAARVAPRWWWWAVAVIGVVVAAAAVPLDGVLREPVLRHGGRSTVVLGAYMAQAWLVLGAALVAARRYPAVAGAAVALALPALAGSLLLVDGSFTSNTARVTTEWVMGSVTVVAAATAWLGARAHLAGRP